MRRSYLAMRDVLGLIARSKRALGFDDFAGVQCRDKVVYELERLKRDGLIVSTLVFEPGGICESGEVCGLTDEGQEFYNLVENDEVWGIILETLKAANVNVPYPLLKEVCEEIVKRYVIRFIPS